MKRLKQILFLFLALGLTTNLNAQYSISDGGTVELECGQATTMTDSNGGGSYGADENFTTTFCPGDGNTIFISFNNNPNTWDVGSGDLLTVYDGPDATYPSLGSFNSTTDPDGVSLSTTLDNPSGCLTFVFTSDGSGDNAGWDAPISCGTIWQPYTVDISTDPEPSENESTDVCQDTEIVYTANLEFPYNDFGGNGYDQTIDNTLFTWQMGDGTIYEGIGLDVVTHTFDGEFAYLVVLQTTDVQGQFQSDDQLVRTSITPFFYPVISEYVNPTCVDVEGTLIGGVLQDTSQYFGVVPNQGTLYAGGILGDQLFLPDGSGENYETSIDIQGFPADATIQSADDIINMCVVMEHSYLGDLEMMLTCPNGTELNIFNSYTGDGLFEGGFGGGGTFLGNALDNTSDPGEGFEYCFTMNAAVILGNGNTVAVDEGTAIEAGDYLPEQDFADFIGCPVNGEWTLTVRDNLGIDDGWIFSWSILFGADINPDSEPYFNYYLSGEWSDNPYITSVNNDTLITYSVPQPGSEDFIFNVTDDFGCSYDTTIVVNVFPRPVLEIDEQGFLCDNGILSVDVLNASNWPAYLYNWTPEDLVSNPTNSETTILDITEDTEFIVVVSPASLPACSSEAAITIPYEEPNPLTVLSNEPTADCPLDLITVTADVSGGIGDYTYSWTVNGESVSSDAQYSFVPGFPGVFSASLEVTDACETIAYPFAIIVNDPGTLIEADELTGICSGEEAGLTISGGTGIYFYDIPVGINLNAGTPSLSGSVGNYIVNISDDCYAFGSIDVEIVACEITLYPNVFSPNSDDFNGTLTFPGLENFPPGSQLRIYDRWGKTVYEDGSYNNDWKGVNSNGNDLSEGTYWYTLEPSLAQDILRSDNNIKSSMLTILR